MRQETVGTENRNQPRFRQNPSFLVIAYLFHLVLPALLLLDVVIAWRRREISFVLWSANAMVAGLSALWLVAGLGAPLLSPGRHDFVRRIRGPLLSIYALYLMLILIEVFAQTTIRLTPPIPGLLPPGRTRFGPVDPSVYPGVYGNKTITVNRLGFRGPMPPRHDAAYRILAVGGSTTICSILDDSEEWPHVLMEEMNASEKSEPVWVGNAGANARDTVDHLVLMQWLPGVVHVDMVIFLVGINDLDPSLAFEGASTQAFLERRAGFQGDLPPGTNWRSWFPLYRRLQIFQLLREATRNLEWRISRAGIPRALDIISSRERRAAAPIVPLPDLHTELVEYRSRLLALANRCRALEMRCLFLTQPSMWRGSLSPAEQRLLWFGWVGRWENPKGYASVVDMARAMDAYNGTLLDVCQENGLECYDLASHIPKDISALFDDVHFNEAGARLVAQNLKQYLLSKSPYSK